MTISNYRSFTNIFIVFLIIFFSTNVYSVSELFSVEVDENIAEINTKDLKKLKTINMERLLFGKATLGFYSDGTIFEAVYSPNSSDQKGEYSALFNENQEFKGIYKIAQSKICYLPDGSDDWQCSILYKHKKIDGIYYWAQKGKIFAKIVKVMEIPEYKKMKFDHSEAEKVRRAEEKRLAEEKRIADAKAAEEKRIADAKAAEEKRIADAKAAEEKRIADEKKKEEIKRIKEETKIAEAKRKEEQKIKEKERIASLQNNFGYQDIKFGMSKRDIINLKVCDGDDYILNDWWWHTCYDKKNWQFTFFSNKNKKFSKILIDLGPYTGEHLSRIRSALSKKYALDYDPCPEEELIDWIYGCGGREMELFNEGEKNSFSIVYRKGSIVLSIYRTYDYDLRIRLYYFDKVNAKKMLKELKPQDTISSDDF